MNIDAPSTPDDADALEAEVVAFDAELSPGVQAPSYEEVTGYTKAGNPTLDHVRDKIEQRAATAIGAEELAAAMPGNENLDEFFAKREKAAKAKLEEIRRSMGK
ncbi:hypothetical protein GOHSU_02_01170 [Gordonia hirsuta DSM 44140 = NBRC 16056]|uniref:Uncharacterized protein n=1 Tax=Gordonia hirsuta DSM 44140 = NBRC 16056 TaxID=1121927 RepID=L7L7J4_9ACTN|nr:hypothetical protein [Gordonia hirsuta]GAC55973.1 hypothetical protein GOHSU_02_01170 [Gordonia hirsuta DSM 44140 = NBRC 16056]